MAKLIINDNEYSLPDQSSIAEVCASAGVIFNCNNGVCGSCLIEVLEGSQRLSDLTQEELDLGLDVHRRLACQCFIQSGTVRIKF